MDGIIIINKPRGFTSQDVVSKTKKILNVKKAGHTGTLDPLATGVLPVLLGNYTKLSKYLMEHDKVYRAKIKFGEERDTGDLEGRVVKTSQVKVEEIVEIKKVLKSMLGKSLQKPPMYSAVKVGGKKLYEYARNGETVEVTPREIEIYKLELIQFREEEQILEVQISCSKGTYIRVLCEDIARKLGTVGFMYELIRTKVDIFSLEEAFDFETLEKNKKEIDKYLIPMEEALKKFPKIKLESKKKELFLNGVNLRGFENLEDGVYHVYVDNTYFGTGIVKDGSLKRDIII